MRELDLKERTIKIKSSSLRRRMNFRSNVLNADAAEEPADGPDTSRCGLHSPGDSEVEAEDSDSTTTVESSESRPQLRISNIMTPPVNLVGVHVTVADSRSESIVPPNLGDVVQEFHDQNSSSSLTEEDTTAEEALISIAFPPAFPTESACSWTGDDDIYFDDNHGKDQLPSRSNPFLEEDKFRQIMEWLKYTPAEYPGLRLNTNLGAGDKKIRIQSVHDRPPIFCHIDGVDNSRRASCSGDSDVLEPEGCDSTVNVEGKKFI
ncbi:hypothetical protein R1sor_027141 [Riccia sorocarpa]|uniref:Uncharacterized protein n=1 Tax=Riccia sorocarpa TaxID=122646 RepID=A0ABD3GDE8_9MARC